MTTKAHFAPLPPPPLQCNLCASMWLALERSKFRGLRKEFVKRMLVLAWERHQGAQAAVVRRGTTVPLSRSEMLFLRGWELVL